MIAAVESQPAVPAVEPMAASLADLEAVIERGLKTFLEVGEALTGIRDGRLYKEAGFETFERYCRDKWGLSKTHANRQVHAAALARALAPMGVTIGSERAARAFGPVAQSPADLNAVAGRLLAEYGSDPLTERQVRAAVDFHIREKFPEATVEGWEVEEAPGGTAVLNHTEEETRAFYGGEGNGAPHHPLKDLSLAYPAPEFDELQRALKKLAKRWDLAGPREVVRQAVLRYAQAEGG